MPETVYDTGQNPSSQLLEFTVPTALNPTCFRGKVVLPSDRVSQPVRVYMRLALQLPAKDIPQQGSTKPPEEKKAGEKVGQVKQKKVVPGSKKVTIAAPVFPYKAPLYSY
jgi:hypothetical protein